jgi:hypothetical protein
MHYRYEKNFANPDTVSEQTGAGLSLKAKGN